VQWASSLTGNWFNSWSDLIDKQATSDRIEFKVPMFYRVAQIPDLTPPSNVLNLQAVSSDQLVTLNWVNPIDPDYQGVVVVRSSTDFPNTPADGTVVYQGGQTSFSDDALSNGATYYYRVFAYDACANYSTGAAVTGLPQGPTTTELVSEVFSDFDGQSNLVSTKRTTDFFDNSVNRFVASTIISNDMVATVSGPYAANSDSGYILIKTLNINGRLEKISNECRTLNGGSGAYSCYMKFYYSDGFTVYSETNTVSASSFNLRTYVNPLYSRIVTKIEVYLRALSSSTPSQAVAEERNTKTSPVVGNEVVLEVYNTSNGGTTLFARLDVSAVRETGDSIRWELTDDIRTNSFSMLSRKYQLTNGLTAPTRLRLILSPSPASSLLPETGIISTKLTLWKQ
jgi:hypothetical protein